MAELEKAGASRLIIDLRGNGGGVLDGALGIAGFFLDKPLVRLTLTLSLALTLPR